MAFRIPYTQFATFADTTPGLQKASEPDEDKRKADCDWQHINGRSRCSDSVSHAMLRLAEGC